MSSILSIPEVAALIERPRTTVWAWVQTVPAWQACISHKAGNRTYLSVPRLIAGGLIGKTK